MKATNDPVEPCEAFSEAFVDVALGEANADLRSSFAAHRVHCARCEEAYRQTLAMLDLVARGADEQMPDSYWASFTRRMDQRLHQAPIQRRRPLVRAAVGTLTFVCLLAVGIWMGRTPRTPAVVGSAPEYTLEQRAALYLDRTAVLLQGLANFDTATDDPTGMDLVGRQTAARDLLAETAALNAALSDRDRLRWGELIADLERILLQIANLEATVDLPAIELVQRGVDEHYLLFKINVARMRIVDDRPASPGPTL
jgi:hypothetical protein